MLYKWLSHLYPKRIIIEIEAYEKSKFPSRDFRREIVSISVDKYDGEILNAIVLL